MADFAWAIALANKLIAANGETSILVRTLGGTPADPEKPWEPGMPLVEETPVRVVYLNHSILRRDSLAKTNESFALMAVDAGVRPDPSTDHLRRAGGQRLAVVKVEPLNPAGDDILYEMKVSA